MNNINNDGDNNITGKLFLKIFRNKVIWNVIKDELEKYSNNHKIRFYKKVDLLEYKDKEYITVLELHFTNLPHAHEIPSSVKTLYIDHFDYNNPSLKSSNIPTTISHLKLGSMFKLSITKGLIPDNIEYLEFTNTFSSTIEFQSIPNSVKTIKYGKYFQFPIFGLNNNIKTLILTDDVDEEIITHSKSISSMQVFKNLLFKDGCVIVPNKIESLIFGREFNRIIKPFSLPETLKSIKFGRYYNQKLDINSLPPGLESLVFGEKFNQLLIDIPSTLTYLEFKNNNYNIDYLNRIPSNIKTIKVGNILISINNSNKNNKSNNNINNYNNNNNNIINNNNNNIFKNIINKIKIF